jgi:hypothetical protein
MKFESKLGIGELAVTAQKEREGCIRQDIFAEVIAITFSKDKAPCYICRLENGSSAGFEEWELIGDDDFDQDEG